MISYFIIKNPRTNQNFIFAENKIQKYKNMFSIGDSVQYKNNPSPFRVLSLEEDKICISDEIDLLLVQPNQIKPLNSQIDETYVPQELRYNKPQNISWKEWALIFEEIRLQVDTKFQYLTPQKLELYKNYPPILCYLYVQTLKDSDQEIFAMHHPERAYIFIKNKFSKDLIVQTRKYHSYDELQFLYFYMRNVLIFQSETLIVESKWTDILAQFLENRMYDEFMLFYDQIALPIGAIAKVFEKDDREHVPQNFLDFVLEKRYLPEDLKDTNWNYTTLINDFSLVTDVPDKEHEIFLEADAKTYKNTNYEKFTEHDNMWVRDLTKKIENPAPMRLPFRAYLSFLIAYSDGSDWDSFQFVLKRTILEDLEYDQYVLTKIFDTKWGFQIWEHMRDHIFSEDSEPKKYLENYIFISDRIDLLSEFFQPILRTDDIFQYYVYGENRPRVALWFSQNAKISWDELINRFAIHSAQQGFGSLYPELFSVWVLIAQTHPVTIEDPQTLLNFFVNPWRFEEFEWIFTHYRNIPLCYRCYLNLLKMNYSIGDTHSEHFDAVFLHVSKFFLTLAPELEEETSELSYWKYIFTQNVSKLEENKKQILDLISIHIMQKLVFLGLSSTVEWIMRYSQYSEDNLSLGYFSNDLKMIQILRDRGVPYNNHYRLRSNMDVELLYLLDPHPIDKDDTKYFDNVSLYKYSLIEFGTYGRSYKHALYIPNIMKLCFIRNEDDILDIILYGRQSTPSIYAFMDFAVNNIDKRVLQRF